jgi:hypothetical protein
MTTLCRRRAVLVTLTGSLFGSFVHNSIASPHATCSKINLGSARSNNKIDFMVPISYRTQIHDSYFRIVLDFPSMTPTVTEPGSARWKSSLDIFVFAYPVGGTKADILLRGQPNVRRGPLENGYQVFCERIDAKSEKINHIFRDPVGNNVVFTEPDFGQRDVLEHGVDHKFLFRCFFAKDMAKHFREIDDRVSDLLRNFQLGNTVRCMPS